MAQTQQKPLILVAALVGFVVVFARLQRYQDESANTWTHQFQRSFTRPAGVAAASPSTCCLPGQDSGYWDSKAPEGQRWKFVNQKCNLRGSPRSLYKKNLGIIFLTDSVDRRMLVNFCRDVLGGTIEYPSWDPVINASRVGDGHMRCSTCSSSYPLKFLATHVVAASTTGPFWFDLQVTYKDKIRDAAQVWEHISGTAPHVVVIGSLYWDLARLFQLQGKNWHSRMGPTLPPQVLTDYSRNLTGLFQYAKASFPGALAFLHHTNPSPRIDPQTGLLGDRRFGYLSYVHQLTAVAVHAAGAEGIPTMDFEAVFKQFSTSQQHMNDTLHPLPWANLEMMHQYLRYALCVRQSGGIETIAGVGPDATRT